MSGELGTVATARHPWGQHSVPGDSLASLGTARCPWEQPSIPEDSLVPVGTAWHPWGQPGIPGGSLEPVETIWHPWGQPGILGDSAVSLGWVGTVRYPLSPHIPIPGSYKSCIPAPLRFQIQQHNFLTRKRIRRRFSKSLRKIGGCQTDGRYLKLKYLLDLERLQRRWAEESFPVRSPGSAADIVIHVAGESGISWSCGGSEVRAGGWAGGGPRWGTR